MKPDVESELYRAMLVARLRLLKSRHKLKIEELLGTPYCFVVSVLDEGISFHVQLELLPSGTSAKVGQIHKVEAQRMLSGGVISMPVMLGFIDPGSEEGLLDFIILPNSGLGLAVNPSFEMKKLTSHSIDVAIDRLISSYDFHASKAS